MKIQLFLSQYKDITPQFEDCQQVNIEQLNHIPQSTCTLIHVGNTCDFIPNRPDVLTYVIQLLRYGGCLIIEGTDLTDISRAIFDGAVKTEDVQGLLFAGRYFCYSLEDVVAELQKLGLKIVKQRLQQYKYYIKAERPHV